MAETTSPDLTARIAELYEADALDEIIRLIESTPGYEHDPELVGSLARAYGAIAEPGETERLEKALALLDTVDEKDRENHYWHYRRAYALFYLDRVIESLPHWEKALEYRPGDADTLDFIRMSKNELVAERFFHPFRERVETIAEEFAKIDNELYDTAALGELGRETALARIRALFAHVANPKWLFELSEEKTEGPEGKPRMKLTVSPCGWFLTTFPMRECLRRLAERASARWSFVLGIEPLHDPDSLMRLVRDAGRRTLHGSDLRIVPQRLEDGTWRLGFFGDDLLGVTEEEAPELFENMIELERQGITAGVFMIRLVPEASDKDKAAARAALEAHLREALPAESVLVTGRGSALRYEYVECFMWESGPVVSAAHDHVRSDPRIAWAAFHSFLREAGTLILKDLESASESTEEGTDEADAESEVKTDQAPGETSDEKAVDAPEARNETETHPEIQPARDDVTAEKEEPARESPIPIAHA